LTPAVALVHYSCALHIGVHTIHVSPVSVCVPPYRNEEQGQRSDEAELDYFYSYVSVFRICNLVETDSPRSILRFARLP
jgi:hypothetical protein